MGIIRYYLHLIGSVLIYYCAILPVKTANNVARYNGSAGLALAFICLAIPVTIFIILPLYAAIHGDFEYVLFESIWGINYYFIKKDNFNFDF